MTDNLQLDERFLREMRTIENRAIRLHAIERGAAAGIASAYTAAGASMILTGVMHLARWVGAKFNWRQSQ